jgi:GTP pyrophosphokinase
MEDLEDRIRLFLAFIRETVPHVDYDKVERAIYFAAKAHEGQMRASGEEYITHPMAVARTLANLHLDTVCIVAGLLHDVLEDCDSSFDELNELFGERVATLVLALTKLNKLEGKSFLLKQSENLKRLLLAVAEDTRVLIVKLADRLHNMQTLNSITNPKKRLRIAKETMEIYAPLADRIGLHFFKNQLYELSFEILYPRIRVALVQEIEALKIREYQDIILIVQEITRIMSESQIDLEVRGREKMPFSIWQKMEKKKVLFENVSDIFAVRIITKDILDCYKALGVIHLHYKVLSREFFDYISTPKPNGYKSLHTVIFFSRNLKVEIQIRTHEMHYLSELGMSAHWIYKQREGTISDKDRGIWLQNIRTIMENLANNSDFLAKLQLDLDYDEVFCITPVGDIVNLQKGGTSLDFAFEIKEGLGFYASKAIVNGSLVPLNHELQNGDQVEIITNDQMVISKEWLHFVKTDKAKRAIREFLDKKMFNATVSSGNSTLQEECAKYNLSLNRKELDSLAKSYNTSLEGLLFKVGKGLLEVDNILGKISRLGLLNKVWLYMKRIFHNKNNLATFTLEDTSEISFSFCCDLEPETLAVGLYNSKDNLIVLHASNCTNIKINSNEKIYKIIMPDESYFYKNKALDITLDSYNAAFNIFRLLATFGLNQYDIAIKSFGQDLVILTINLRFIMSYQIPGLVTKIQNQSDVLQVAVI